MQVGRQVSAGGSRRHLCKQDWLVVLLALASSKKGLSQQRKHWNIVRHRVAYGTSSCGIVIVYHRHRLASSASGMARHRIASDLPNLCWSIALHRLDAGNTRHRIALHRQAEDQFLIASPRRISLPWGGLGGPLGKTERLENEFPSRKRSI